MPTPNKDDESTISHKTEIFISYAHLDSSELAHRLANELPQSEFNVWLDEKIKGGDVWTEEIMIAIDNCDVALIFISKGSFVSEICNKELIRCRRKNKNLIPIRVQKNADHHLHLEGIQYIDFTNAYGDGFNHLLTELRNVRPTEEIEFTPPELPKSVEPNLPIPSPIQPEKESPNNSFFTSSKPSNGNKQSNNHSDSILSTSKDGLLSPYHYANLITRTPNFQTNEKRDNLSSIISENLANTESAFIRLQGLAGIGKSRFVLETILNNNLQDTTVYALKPSDIPDDWFSNAEKEQLTSNILVIDNCTIFDASRFKQLQKAYDTTLNILTIEEIEPSNQRLHNKSDVYVLEPLEPTSIEAIITPILKSPNIGLSWQISHLLQGNVKVSIAIGEIIHQNPHIEGISQLCRHPEIYKALQDLVPTTVDPQDLRALCLMKQIGLYGEVVEQGRLIAEITGTTLGRLQIAASQLASMGLAQQHGQFYKVYPPLLAIAYGVEAWRAWGDSVTNLILSDESNPALIGMYRPLLERLGELGDQETAEPIVRKFFYA